MTRSIFLQSTLTGVDPKLFGEYRDGDLRKDLYFEDSGLGFYNFKGSYTGDSEYFAGLTTREQFLIRAECYARSGNVDLAMADLNALLVTRWDDRFVNLKARSKEEALSMILNGIDYRLPPNVDRSVFLIPFQEVQMTGITQNIR